MMKYPKEYIEEIKSRLKVSKVVGSYVKLQKRGKEFVGLSPFSNEKTPSFTVNDDKGFYHCFSTAEHGNIFDFIMKTQNLKFGEAVKKLASEAGLQAYRFTKLDEEKEKKWKIYSSLLEEYKNFCKKELNSGKYKNANEYLKKRKFREEDIRFFEIGYVDIKSNFYECIKQKYNNEQILNSGIFYFDENRKKYVERFKGRIIFPIKNINGTAIAFAGRTIVSSKFAKYINSPETLFYKKGNNLYNINSAKKTTNLKDEILIVEGFMDVISLHKFGIQNVVANQGTALTQNQLELSWRFFKNVIICFDGDKSGYQAAARAAERLFSIIKIDHSIAFLFLPSNLDPDNYIHSNGKEDFNNLIKKKVSIHDFLWEHHYNNTKSNDPSSLASFEKTIKNLCNKIADKSLSKYFLEYFLNKISNLTPNINYKKNNFYKFKKNLNPLPQTKKSNIDRDKFSETTLKEYSILYIIINNLEFFSKRIEVISEVPFISIEAKNFISKLVNNIASGNIYNLKTFNDYFKNSEYNNFILEVNNFAPVKIIIQNKKNEELSLIFEDILQELKKIGADSKIKNLEEKVAKQMDEKSYQELLDLKSKVNEG